jgi:hypothetical protein
LQDRGLSMGREKTKKRRQRRTSNALRWLPRYAWQAMARSSPGSRVHLLIAVADHFEPAIVSGDGRARAPQDEQERRLNAWCRDYPALVDSFRDRDGRPLCHTYFYPAEQYQSVLVEQLAEHCQGGWGEIEIHLHHGMESPDTAENTRQQLVEFRDALALRHGNLSYEEGSELPRYAFVHGNFALANSSEGRNCGVDSEMQILAETGCYADLTLPAAPFHPAQTARINALYEIGAPLSERAPHRRGMDLRVGTAPEIFPLMVQGPLMLDFGRRGIENAALTGPNPASLSRLRLWKRAGIGVRGRPDWVFIKLHCHSMDPTQRDAVLGGPARRFLRELVEGAEDRGEILHFVTAREMVNIMLAACEGREGNPGDYRDYRLRRRVLPPASPGARGSRVALQG